ncbi:hypothetical protein [uncultured Kriegella sp.]|uniref:hypothetical protein n=1 Tax=uncultured Kriegella sp. TaxID=1798910 RepID=UPI0030DA48E0|tara:strand:+ start:32306 stop:32872 length:567 start_codon:yes stop_codon:yes gene_type:complete
MAQDLREMFEKKSTPEAEQLRGGHKERFLERLNAAIPEEKSKPSFFAFKIAASLLLLVSVGGYLYNTSTQVRSVGQKSNVVVEKISLGDLSPDLKKVENYYISSINMELSKLNLTDENKTLIDSFMEHMEELDHEYDILSKELNDIGPNDQTITALIKNLQLRLQLLQKLKVRLNDLKASKNETSTII